LIHAKYKGLVCFGGEDGCLQGFLEVGRVARVLRIHSSGKGLLGEGRHNFGEKRIKIED
jgi:hypothetical protein